MELLGYMGHVEAILVYLERVFILAQDRCTVYAKCPIGLEIFLGHLMVS
jgi:hypothetical protein